MTTEEDNETTPEEARAVWDSLDAPSVDKVYERLKAAGKKITINKLRTWYRNNWFMPSIESDAIAIDRAASAADTKIPLLTGNPRNGLRNMIPDKQFKSKAFAEQVAEMNEMALLKTTPREAMAAAAVIFREVQKQRRELLKSPKELGDLMKSLGSLMESSVASMERALNIVDRGRRMEEIQRRTIDVTPADEIDPDIQSLMNVQ